MNLHGIAAPAIGVVNPNFQVGIQISIGQGPTESDGNRPWLYATPGASTGSIGGTFTGSTSGSVLTVAAVLTGSLQPTDLVSGSDSTNSLSASIESQLSGNPGGVGTYQLSGPAGPGDLGSCEITSLSTVLNATAIAQGALLPGQTIAGAGIAAGTMITGQISGASGGPGTYSVNQAQTAPSTGLTTSTTLMGQVQPVQWRDLQQLDGLNITGIRWKIYLYGEVDGIVRPEKKGGDLITIPPGNRHAGVWLVVGILEQWPDWVCAGIVLQNGS